MRGAAGLNVGNLNVNTLIVGAIALLAAYVYFRGVKGAAADAVKIVVKTAEGVVVGIGTTVGLPETDAKACEDYIAAGDWWNASFYCPAGTFLKSAAGTIFNSSSGEVVGYTEPGEPEIITIEENPLITPGALMS